MSYLYIVERLKYNIDNYEIYKLCIRYEIVIVILYILSYKTYKIIKC